jgi:thioredoxin-related protein
MLENILQEEEDSFVFFYDEDDTEADTILEELEQIDEKLDKQDMTMVKISDSGAKDSFGIEEIPALVYFEHGIPELYEGDLFNDQTVMKWMRSELKQEEIKEISVLMLDRLVERGKTLAVVFYDPEGEDDIVILRKLEHIDDDCSKYEINFVKLKDTKSALEYGIEDLPGLLYFENRIPSIYDGDLQQEEELLDWLIEQKTTETIEKVTEKILAMLIEEEEYLAVFFSGPCSDDDPCDQILEEFESIDSKIREYGIMLVTTEQRDLAKQYEVRTFPSLGIFRNGDFVLYEGDLDDELVVLEWLTDRKTLSLTGQVEEVNSQMLAHLIEDETDVVVLLYRDGNIQDEDIISSMENIDDEMYEKDVEFVKCSSRGVEKDYGISTIPALVHFADGIPLLYHGDFDEPDDVLKWVLLNLESTNVEEVTAPILEMLMEVNDNLAVIFFGHDDEKDEIFLSGMEKIDDECDNVSIPLVKINDHAKAVHFGIEEEDLPQLLYFKRGVPGLFDGDMTHFAGIYNWLVDQKSSTGIHLVSDAILENVIDSFDYVAALFTGVCKEGNHACEENIAGILEVLEDISDEAKSLGIILVKDEERTLAFREYNVTSFPSLGLFRNGHILLYPGDAKSDGAAEVLNWLSDTATIEVPGVVEKVGQAMLRNVIESEEDVLGKFTNYM